MANQIHKKMLDKYLPLYYNGADCKSFHPAELIALTANSVLRLMCLSKTVKECKHERNHIGKTEKKT